MSIFGLRLLDLCRGLLPLESSWYCFFPGTLPGLKVPQENCDLHNRARLRAVTHQGDRQPVGHRQAFSAVCWPSFCSVSCICGTSWSSIFSSQFSLVNQWRTTAVRDTTLIDCSSYQTNSVSEHNVKGKTFAAALFVVWTSAVRRLLLLSLSEWWELMAASCWYRELCPSATFWPRQRWHKAIIAGLRCSASFTTVGCSVSLVSCSFLQLRFIVVHFTFVVVFVFRLLWLSEIILKIQLNSDYLQH